MPPRWLPLALFLLTILGEARTWRDFAARAAPSAQDAGSLRLDDLMAILSVGLGVAAALALRDDAPWREPAWVAWAGVPLSLAGTALRAWAVSTLGRWFTLTIQVRPGQPVVDTGPYRLIRHPSYAGGELALLGVGLATGTWVAAVGLVAPWMVAHAYRIRVEERAMAETLGIAYRRYQARTWRMVPFVW